MRLNEHLHPIETALQSILPADLLVFKFDSLPQHVALVSEVTENHTYIIHAYIKSRKVTEHRLDADWQEKIVAAYRFSQFYECS